jgi:hypothetical protein
MGYFIKEGLGLLLGLVVFIQARHYLRWRSLRKWGEQFGCENAPTVPNYLPGGLERFSVIFKDFKSMLIIPHSIPYCFA